MRITREQLIRASEAMGYPTNTAFASSLWRLSCNGAVDYDEGAQLMRDCGYLPYCGFPLHRSGRIEKMGRAEVEVELSNNPLCSMTEEAVFIPMI